jgi:5-methylcytosine-specific restriction endonuclease McrA
MPGCKSKTRLQVHHIRRWSSASSLRYEISNGITLCSTCHKSIKGQEHHYESLFMEIINGI